MSNFTHSTPPYNTCSYSPKKIKMVSTDPPAPAAERIYSTILVACRSILSKGSTIIRFRSMGVDSVRASGLMRGSVVRGRGQGQHSSHTGDWSELCSCTGRLTLTCWLAASPWRWRLVTGRRVLESFGSRDTRSFLIVSLLLTLMRVRCTYGANLKLFDGPC